MIIETKIDSNKYLKLMFTMAYRKLTTIIPTIIGFIMILSSVLYFTGFNIPFDGPPHFVLIFGIFIVAILPFSIYRNAKNNYTSLGRIQEKIIYEFTDEKIVETGETFSSEMDWLDFYRIQELKYWIILYNIDGSAIFIPKEAFGENLNAFKNLVMHKDLEVKLRK